MSKVQSQPADIPQVSPLDGAWAYPGSGLVSLQRASGWWSVYLLYDDEVIQGRDTAATGPLEGNGRHPGVAHARDDDLPAHAEYRERAGRYARAGGGQT
jgi:hypothetical protein